MAVKKSSTKKTVKKKAPVKKKQAKKADENTLLLEIGTEEIPARFLLDAGRNLIINLKKLLRDNSIITLIKDEDRDVYATPRRLAIIIRDLPLMQKDRTREAYGPPKQAAFDKDGNPTKAALGFARSQGVEVSDLQVRPKEGKGEYLYIEVDEKGKPTEELLPDIFKELILTLPFPKSMRWGNGSITYARPIHWVVALLGSKVIDFELEGIKSGNKSRGHRFLSPKEFVVDSPDKYVDLLKKKHVIVKQGERSEIIKDQCENLTKSVSGKPSYVSHDHPDFVANLVEYPHAVLGSFEEKYLNLPPELLNSVMWGHQKYFSVVNNYSDNKLINNFIIISNTVPGNSATVRKGAERVLRARFDDAVFYFEEDRQKKLSDRIEDLRKVTFQDKLGSLYDKTIRVKEAAGKVADLLAPDAKANAERAAELAKSDLISGVVSEFPELQGIMGMYYARLDGEGDAVADAIWEQYLPAFSGDRIPETEAGTILSLAEKLDNIASFFSIGLKPTGSEDPYALRRQAIGMLAILEGKGYEVSIADLLGTVSQEGSELKADMIEFFEQRIEPLLAGKGFAHDLVQAVIKRSALVPFKDIIERLEALQGFKSDPDYNDFLIGIKRVRNIAPDEIPSKVDEALMSESTEKALYKEYRAVRDEVVALASKGQYDGAIDAMKKLTATINKFFDDVLVMDKDEAVKNNRLSLLKELDNMAVSVADFSQLDERA